MWLLLACGAPVDTSLVTELRVMAIVPEAPELSPGQPTSVAAQVLDPAGAGAEVWVWACSPIGQGCLGEPPAPAAAPLGDGPVIAAVEADPGLVAAAGETPRPLLVAWALACAPGVCADFFDEPAALADPSSRMATVPIAGTSLGFWPIAVSTREDRHQNPVLVGPEAPDDLAFTVSPGAGRVYAYTTAGSFGEAGLDVEDGRFELEFTPPEEGGADVLVVFDDEVGGIATWRGRVD